MRQTLSLSATETLAPEAKLSKQRSPSCLCQPLNPPQTSLESGGSGAQWHSGPSAQLRQEYAQSTGCYIQNVPRAPRRSQYCYSPLDEATCARSTLARRFSADGAPATSLRCCARLFPLGLDASETSAPPVHLTWVGCEILIWNTPPFGEALLKYVEEQGCNGLAVLILPLDPTFQP